MKLNFKLVGLALSATLLVASCGKQNDEDILPPSPPEQQYGGNDSLIGTWYDVNSLDTFGVFMSNGMRVTFTDSTMHGESFFPSGDSFVVYNKELYMVSNDTLFLPEPHNVGGVDDDHPFISKFKFYSIDTLWIEYFLEDISDQMFPFCYHPVILVRSKEVGNEE
jgi:hypothetical protein